MVYTNRMCLDCAARNRGTCCELKEHYLPLTIDDINRILSLGYKLEDFAAVLFLSGEDLKGEEEWWIKRMVVKDGKHLVLVMKTSNHGCVMLKKGIGCSIGEHRGTMCRLFPFWMDSHGKITYLDDFCELSKTKLTKGSFKKIGETQEKVSELYKALRDDTIKNMAKHRELIEFLLKKGCLAKS